MHLGGRASKLSLTFDEEVVEPEGTCVNLCSSAFIRASSCWPPPIPQAAKYVSEAEPSAASHAPGIEDCVFMGYADMRPVGDAARPTCTQETTKRSRGRFCRLCKAFECEE